MSNSKVALCGVFAVLQAVVGCGPHDAQSEVVAESGEAVINGHLSSAGQVNHIGLVAVYHMDPSTGTWFPRPCSGWVMRSSGNVSWVLTARHCVTNNGEVTGTVMTKENFFFSPTPTPGHTQPPGGALPAAADPIAMPLDPQQLTDIHTRDLALVRVNFDMSPSVQSRLGMFVGPPTNLANEGISAFGYGRGAAGCSSVEGTGIARWAPFTITNGVATTIGGRYWHNNTSTNGLSQALTCGDSGGPDYAPLGTEDFSWGHILGIHSSGTTGNAQSSVFGKWIQDTFGGLFVSSYFNPNMNLGVTPVVTARMYTTTSSRVALFTYEPGNQWLRWGPNGTCLASNMTFLACSTATSRRWTFTVDMRLKSNSDLTKCLTHSATDSLTLEPCGSSSSVRPRQMWAFHAQR